MRQLMVIVFAGFLAMPLAAQETAAVIPGDVASGDAAPAEDGAPAPEEAPPAFGPLNAADISLQDFQWLNRPIVIFADSPADPRFQKQLELLLERPEDLLDRDIVLIVDTDPRAGSEIRNKLRPRGFMLTLIGKDGGIKLRKPFPWDLREITRAIDKWPLRKQEVRDRTAVTSE